MSLYCLQDEVQKVCLAWETPDELTQLILLPCLPAFLLFVSPLAMLTSHCFLSTSNLSVFIYLPLLHEMSLIPVQKVLLIC